MSRLLRLIVLTAMIAVGALSYTSAAQASVNVSVDISQQKMFVYVGGELAYAWPVSTGRKGYYTPRGQYRPKRMARMHYSRKYNNAPMPYAVFFNGGYAIHGTNAVRRLGRPASHGCVRLANGNARELYQLIRENGGDARITIRA